VKGSRGERIIFSYPGPLSQFWGAVGYILRDKQFMILGGWVGIDMKGGYFCLTPCVPLSNQQHLINPIDNLIGEGEIFIRGAFAPLRVLLPLWGVKIPLSPPLPDITGVLKEGGTFWKERLRNSINYKYMWGWRWWGGGSPISVDRLIYTHYN
jgi:hypothetical protein